MVEKYRPDKLQDFLEEKGICEQIAHDFFVNDISGDLFLLLNKSEIKELAPKLSDRIKLRELIKKVGFMVWTDFIDIT